MSQKTVTKKIAIFQTPYDSRTICTYDCIPDSYIRISEWKDVEFTMKQKDELINAEIKLIDNKIGELTLSSLKQVEVLNTRKQELLALPEDIK